MDGPYRLPREGPSGVRRKEEDICISLIINLYICQINTYNVGIKSILYQLIIYLRNAFLSSMN